jgi:hypoxanthine phosphoribosyltransferase
MTGDKVALSFEEISRRLRGFAFPPGLDAVVGIATGGTVPAFLIAHQLGLPVHLVGLNYRDEENLPRHPAPRQTAVAPAIPRAQHRLLLVDEVSVTGRTLKAARALLPGRAITTFVLKGSGPADLKLFPEIEPCVLWPWKSPA